MTTALYPAEKYTYRVLWAEEHQRYVGVCSEFPGLSYQARTHAAALDGIIARVRVLLEDKRVAGEAAPPPKSVALIGGRS